VPSRRENPDKNRDGTSRSTMAEVLAIDTRAL
jgi:hypothetical protein